ncbi:peroxisome biogenesis factor 2 [Chelonus insularis]|uniref:peroxisome biogenesis factor 2 n=1 Tax=Chelonus insularis TaxID=460826 RepID=UPI00158E03B7|nr:peroxisome biogenesis factor 2 [Chelonus insularis]
MGSIGYVSRINQLDALQLDNEIDRIILSRTTEIFQYFMPKVIQSFHPELNAVLRTAIGVFSLSKNKSTFGQKLLDLNFLHLSRTKATLFLIFSIFPKYLKDRYLDENRITEQKNIQKYVEKIINSLRILNLVNLLFFLNQAKYPTLVDRTLGITHQNTVNHKARTIGYSYMTRELLWHGLLDLFSAGLPAINFHFLKQCYLTLRKTKHNNNSSLVKPLMKLDTTCPYCEEVPTLPYHAGCQHIYCYYCLEAHFTATESFKCLACGQELHSANKKVYTV